MLVWVPEPVCHTTRGKWSASFPAVISWQAAQMASKRRSSRRPSWWLAMAAACFKMPKARRSSSGIRSVPILKFSWLRWVWAPQYRSAGTRISPMLSRSTR